MFGCPEEALAKTAAMLLTIATLAACGSSGRSCLNGTRKRHTPLDRIELRE